MLKFASVLAPFALVAAAPATAATADPVRADVATADLDLAKSADQLRLDRRIKRTIRTMCDTGGRDRVALNANRMCVALATRSAVLQIDRAVALAETRGVKLAAIASRVGG